MYDAGLALVEQLLMVSAREVASDKHAGRAAGDVRWHGSQPGRIVMDERKLRVQRPRLRVKRGKEVPDSRLHAAAQRRTAHAAHVRHHGQRRVDPKV